jgi:hypothetical protein
MRILHVTYHSGCVISVDYICKKLGYQLETQRANWNYNISQDLADSIWKENCDYYNSFDCVITSDTAPLSRIFLRDQFIGKLIIWVCNRFDYSDSATNSVNFPDNNYYDLFKSAIKRDNTFVRSYTKFEHEYAKKYREIEWDTDVFRPVSIVDKEDKYDLFPSGQLKSNTFLITRYHNDNIYMDLKNKCDELGIETYRGEYNGPSDLIGIKGIIHIPYAWSNLAIFENWSIGNVYFIPSKNFLLDLSFKPNFFWSPPFDRSFIESSEWYLPDHKDLFIYFNSFDHLLELTKNEELIKEKRNNVINFSKIHEEKCISQWKAVIEK